MKIPNNPLVVLDTNVFMVSLASHSPYAAIFDALIEGHFRIAVSTEILAEYEEKIAERYDFFIVKDVFELFLNLSNVVKQDIYFNWLLIVTDPDDDKFSDIAVAVNADCLVSNDKHFNILQNVDFPKIQVIKAEEFVAFCQKALSNTI